MQASRIRMMWMPRSRLNRILLIHMTHATKKQIRECADREIPIVVCPRSNWVLGVTTSARYPPVHMMLDLGCTVYLGTDNAMFVPPDMFSEMAFAAMVYRLDPKVVLRSAIGGSQFTGSPFFIREGARAAFFTLDPSHSALAFSRDRSFHCKTCSTGLNRE